MRNILFICYSFPPEFGGAENVAYNYASTLSNNGFNVTVVCRRCFNRNKSSFKFKLFEVKNVFGSKLYMLNYLLFFKNFDFSFYDTIILNGTQAVAASGRWLSSEVLSKSIPIIQGQEVEIYYDKRVLNRFFYNDLMRLKVSHIRAIKLSRKVVCVSIFQKNKYLTMTNLGCLDYKFTVVHNSINKTIFNNIGDFDKCNFFKGKNVLITASRIIKMKGFVEMLKIFQKTLSINPNYIWVIAGDGCFLPKFKKMVVKLNLENNILFLGKLDSSTLCKYYRMSDCFWLLSNYEETFGLVYLEAQACGIPAIGRNKGAIREVIKDKNTGFIINSDDECVDILIKEEFKNMNKQQILNFADTFDLLNSTMHLIS